jgi:hypothetical protein
VAEVLYLKLNSAIEGIIFSTMTIRRIKQQNRLAASLLPIVALIALLVTMVGIGCESDCTADCQDEPGAGCVCIFCPGNVVMTLTDEHSIQFEYANCLWTLTRVGSSGEQEWFTNIDYPPRDLS